jgi:hypothetical protein
MYLTSRLTHFLAFFFYLSDECVRQIKNPPFGGGFVVFVFVLFILVFLLRLVQV